MNSCAPSPDATIGSTAITWAQASLNNLTNFPSTSYLRPNTGGSLLPWIYTVVLILLHLPMVIIRVVRWEAVQSWCLVASFFTVVVYTQAYISTQFDPAKVLVWTPIILVIDAGSMLQVFFLVIEAKKVKVGKKTILVDHEDNSHGQAPDALELTSQVSSSLLSRYRVPSGPANTAIQRNGQLKWSRDPAVYSAVCAALIFVAILALQLVGLAQAAKIARASSNPPAASFCSPLFQPFGLAVVDGDCHAYTIEQSAHQGIGCIELPGVWQQQWIKGTVVGISIELVTQFVDLLILTMTNGSKKWREIKLKRPWATMFSGVVVLIIMLLYGVFYATNLPVEITTRVMVVMDVQGPASYEGELTTAGLRGAIIGWNDGLFESWNTTYFGT